MSKLNEQDCVNSDDWTDVRRRYWALFPDDDGEWDHPAMACTRDSVVLMEEAIARGTPITRNEVEARFAPWTCAWDW